MNKTDLQNLLFNVRHHNISVEDATKNLLTDFFKTNGYLEPAVEPKKEVWEIYPDYKSCIKNRKKAYYPTFEGYIYVSNTENASKSYLCSSEKLAKRQLAELQLFAIAEKWGEGIEGKMQLFAPVVDIKNKLICDVFDKDFMLAEYVKIYFKTEEQCKKSIELHERLWKDYFMID